MMTSVSRMSSDLPIPPGEILAEEIEARGMTQRELAVRIGRPVQVVNEIVRAKKAITPETAIELGNVFGMSARFWMNLESEYRMTLARHRKSKELEANVKWLDEYPVNTMIRRGWMEKGLDRTEKLQALLLFLEVAVPEPRAFQQAIGFQVPETASNRVSLGALSVWLRMGELAARTVETADFNAVVFHNALTTIRKYTKDQPMEFLPKMSEVCAEAGVAFNLVKELPKSGAIAATRWLSEHKALIQMSLKQERADSFWYTFYREASHLLKHRKRQRIVIEGLEEELINSETDVEADEYTRDLLIAQENWREFCGEGRFDSGRVNEFAKSLEIAPFIIVGRLQSEGRIGSHELKSLKRRYSWKQKPHGHSTIGQYIFPEDATRITIRAS